MGVTKYEKKMYIFFNTSLKNTIRFIRTIILESKFILN